LKISDEILGIQRELDAINLELEGVLGLKEYVKPQKKKKKAERALEEGK
jgi:hypothetical protein